MTNPDYNRGNPEGNPEQVLQRFDALKKPLEDIAKRNPVVGENLLRAYERITEELIVRLTEAIAGGEDARIRRLSPERAREFSDALKNIEVNLPNVG